MNAELWERIQAVLPELKELSPSHREVTLHAIERAEPALAIELRRLLETPDPKFLATPEMPDPIADHSQLEAGARIGEFEIVHELGRGGMGVVYRARQAGLAREVALKVLATARLHAEGLVRFNVEAQAAARLRHPNIVPVFSAGESDGYRYIAMECVDGVDLAQVVAALKLSHDEPAGMPRFEASGYTRRVAEIVRSIADALEYAHAHGILHRDVKPKNILLDRCGRAFLVDFGLAKDLRGESFSVSGQILGTPHYMSPEQAEARGVKIDHRTDVFSLGAVMYELLTLERPFVGDDLKTVFHAISVSDPIAIRRQNPRVHRDLETICAKALEKSRERRFASAGEFARELERFLANEPLTIRRSWPIERVIRRVRRNRPAMVLGVALVALAVALPLAWRSVRVTEAKEAIASAERALATPGTTTGELRARLDQLTALAGRVSGASEARRLASIDTIRARGRQYADQWRAAEARAIEAQSAESWSESDAAFAEARARLFDARVLLPDDAQLAEAREVTLPTLTIRTDRSGLRVSVRAIDLVTGVPGPWRELGRTPVHALPIARGYYSFEIADSAGRSAEFVRLLDRLGERVELQPRLLPSADTTAGMVAIPGACIELSLADRGDVSVDVAPFWIDATEVTIGQYRAFLHESGQSPPRYWNTAALRRQLDELLQPDVETVHATAWDDRPMAGVTYDEARAYAEWRGARIPSVYEFDLAARGPELRRYPWTSAVRVELSEVLTRAVLRDPLQLGSSAGAVAVDPFDDYLIHVVPVTSMPEGRGPYGLFHAYGNVKEWTSTLAVTRGRDDERAQRLAPQLGVLLIRGKGWDSVVERGRTVFDLNHFDQIPGDYAPFSLGFRCAKSGR